MTVLYTQNSALLKSYFSRCLECKMWIQCEQLPSVSFINKSQVEAWVTMQFSLSRLRCHRITDDKSHPEYNAIVFRLGFGQHTICQVHLSDYANDAILCRPENYGYTQVRECNQFDFLATGFTRSSE